MQMQSCFNESGDQDTDMLLASCQIPARANPVLPPEVNKSHQQLLSSPSASQNPTLFQIEVGIIERGRKASPKSLQVLEGINCQDWPIEFSSRSFRLVYVGHLDGHSGGHPVNHARSKSCAMD